MVTQLAKMIFLATFFPVAIDEDEDQNAEVPFDFLTVIWPNNSWIIIRSVANSVLDVLNFYIAS